jgi:hypothetical protein
MERRAGKLLRSVWLACGLFFCAARGHTQTTPPDTPAANPARPTVSNPATLTPPGYLQFETGVLGAMHSGEFSSLVGISEVIKLSVAKRLELLAASGPFVHSTTDGVSANGTAEVFLGMQAVAYRGQDARPTLAFSYFRRIYGGNTPDLDVGSPRNSLIALASADVKGFHYDANVLLNEVGEGSVHRAQFAQTLSISHPIGERFTLAGEIWHFSQPFLRSNAVGNLWAVSYTVRPNLVLDGGFNHGLTSTSTRWEVFAGFTYLLPHKLWR